MFRWSSLDTLTLMTLGIFLFSVIVFVLFGLFTLRLIKQHRNINALLYALEEQEKENQ